WVDEQVKIDDNGTGKLVTSRKPDDLKAFCDAFLHVFAEGAG
ncbi:MAG: protease, partial [Streptomyces sp.]|nr:protease [Streptomyces sp.]